MKIVFRLAFLFLSTVLLLAQAQAQSGGVAILNIDKAAEALGVDRVVNAEMANVEKQVNAQLAIRQENLQAQMDGVTSAAGENPDDAKKREILATNQQLNQQFNQTKSRAGQGLQAARTALVNRFRADFQPYALEAAKAEGLDIVMFNRAPALYTWADKVEITDSAVELAKKGGLPDKWTMPVPVTDDQARDKAISDENKRLAEKAKADTKEKKAAPKEAKPAKAE